MGKKYGKSWHEKKVGILGSEKFFFRKNFKGLILIEKINSIFEMLRGQSVKFLLIAGRRIRRIIFISDPED